MMNAASNRALSPLTVRTELACARTLLDELEARLASGNAHGGSRDLASLAEADVILEAAR
jgi:hypothetical protein